MKPQRHTATKVWIEVLCAALASVVIAYFFLGFQYINFQVPILYKGDGLTGLMGIKSILNESNALRGWPFFQDTTQYSAQYRMLYKLFIVLCKMLGLNFVASFNLYLLAIPALNIFVCYLVLRYGFHTRWWISLLSAATFGMCPYVQWRFIAHMALASIECIPLTILLCVWCVEDPKFNSLGKGFFHYKRNWYALFFSWMIANNGMVYYPFFTCFIFCVVILWNLLGGKSRWLRMAAPLTLIAEVAFFLMLAFIPTVIGILNGAGNVATNGAVRSVVGAYVYGMNLNALFLSPHGFGIEPLKRLYKIYDEIVDVGANENTTAYMGIIAILGFVLLIVTLFKQHHSEQKGCVKNRLWLFACCMIMLILLATSMGFGTLVGMVVTMIRCYNRVSPFIVGLCVFAVALWSDDMLTNAWARWPVVRAKKDRQTNRNMTRRGLCCLAVCCVFMYGLWEQHGCYNDLAYLVQNEAGYLGDEQFVGEIEDAAGEGAIIFQLPYMRSFENGPTRDIPDYDHLRGVLHSDTLRWSFGAQRDSENDLWYQYTADLPPVLMIEELRSKGISGIYLNLDGYAPEEGESLKEALCFLADCQEPIWCQDNHTLYIPLSENAVNIRDLDADTRLRLGCYELGTILSFTANDAIDSMPFGIGKTGFSAKEPAGTWTDGDHASMALFIAESDRDLTCSIELAAVLGNEQRMTILVNNQEVYQETVTNENLDINFLIPQEAVDNGVLHMEFLLPDAHQPGTADARILGISVKEIVINATEE